MAGAIALHLHMGRPFPWKTGLAACLPAAAELKDVVSPDIAASHQRSVPGAITLHLHMGRPFRCPMSAAILPVAIELGTVVCPGIAVAHQRSVPDAVIYPHLHMARPIPWMTGSTLLCLPATAELQALFMRGLMSLSYLDSVVAPHHMTMPGTVISLLLHMGRLYPLVVMGAVTLLVVLSAHIKR